MLSPEKIKELQKLHTQYEKHSKEFDGGKGDSDSLAAVWRIGSLMENIIYSYSTPKKKKKMF